MAMAAPALLTMIGTIATTGLSIASSAASAKQQKAQLAARQQQIALQRQQAQVRHQIEARRLEKQRETQIASARARLGASGIGSTGGSGAALLGNINSQFDEQQAASDQLFALSQVQPNLLDNRAQRLGQLSSIIGKGVGLGQQIVGIIKD